MSKHAPLAPLTDPRSVLEAIRRSAPELLVPGGRLAHWRIFPLRPEGFAVRWVFEAPQASRPIEIHASSAAEEGDGPAFEFGDVVVRAFSPESDPRFPSLGALLRGEVPLPGGARAREVRLLSYRPHVRATCRLTGGRGEVIYARASAQRRRFERVLSAHRFATGLEGPGGPLFARLRGEDRPRRILFVEEAAGPTLHELLQRGDEPGDERLAALAGNLDALARRDPAGLPRQDPVDEAEVTAWFLTRAREVSDSVSQAEPLLPSLFDAASSLDEGSVGVCHRDLHDKQIVFSGRAGAASVRLLDPDTISAADPLFDLANLLIHAELRVLQGRAAPHAARRVRSFLLARPRGCPIDPRRLSFHAACTWLRLAGVYALRSSGSGLAALLAARARRSLERVRSSPSLLSVEESP